MIKAMNIGMKILPSLIVVFHLLESIEARMPTNTIEVNGPSGHSKCNNNNETDLICDFTDPYNQYIVHVSKIDTNSSMNLRIVGAHTVKLTDQFINYSEIILESCNEVETRASKYSSYKLFLINSTASCITETVNYFKSTDSEITTLVLSNTTEFDIVNSKIGTLEAKSNSLTPKIVSSNVTTMDLEISGNSELTIEDSRIDMVKKLNYASIKKSLCVNSNLKTIPKNSIEISDGEMLISNTKFRADSQAFKIKKGTLVFDNITSRLYSENVILESDGLFMLRIRDPNKVFTMRFEIEDEFYNGENNKTFFPLEKVMLKDHTLLISLSLLALVIFITILIITLYVVYKKYKLSKKNTMNCKSFDDSILNREKQEEVNKNNGREYVRRNQDMNKDNTNKEEIDPNKQRVNESDDYSDSQVSSSQNVFSVINKNTDTLLIKNYNNRRVNESYDYNDSQVSPGPKIPPFPNKKTEPLIPKDKNVFEINELGYNEPEDYSQPDILNQEEPQIYSEVDVQESAYDVEDYSDINYPSELNQKLYNKSIINLNSDKFSSNDVMYSDNSYPSVKVNELKEHLKNVGLNNAQLHSPYRRPDQVNTNTQNKGNNPKIFPKPINTNFNPNSQTGKQNVPNVSFLSRNKDQIGKLEPPNILPQVNPPLPKHFLLNKSQPPPNTSNRSLKTQPILPIQSSQVEEEEENYYEEFTQN